VKGWWVSGAYTVYRESAHLGLGWSEASERVLSLAAHKMPHMREPAALLLRLLWGLYGGGMYSLQGSLNVNQYLTAYGKKGWN
jgi:hypothetical protein